ncbi:MAG: hypothetical protein J6I62_10140 [Selenomonadaceae bacterium]|nr:hypothetical protein [Selenomonadaceae bacterium]
MNALLNWIFEIVYVLDPSNVIPSLTSTYDAAVAAGTNNCKSKDKFILNCPS